MPKEEYKWDVYLSYSFKNSIIADRIYKLLQYNGYRVFNSSTNLKAGENIQVAIERALFGSKNFLILLGRSDSISGRNYLRQELNEFNKLSGETRRIFPIIIDDSLPRFLLPDNCIAPLRWDMQNECESLRKLIEGLGEPTRQRKIKLESDNIIHKRSGKEWSVEITLDENYDELTIERQEKLLRTIEELLGKGVKVSLKKKGSVVYRITLDPEDAARVFLAAQNGELGDFKIKDASLMQHGNRVFIGHGRSPLWRELKEFLADRLNLEWDEYNREPIAGINTTERLNEMADSAAFALLIMTSEDEHADGSLHARENVIHEIGLFQGKLGFGRAIILLEDGCKEFTNVAGLGQIRFPKGAISACFEEIRRVLERESII